MPLTIAAMPAYNEAHAISNVILGCKKYIDKVVVIDDGSSDNTLDNATILPGVEIGDGAMVAGGLL